MKCTAIIPAAGQGRRMNSQTKKQYLTLKDKPILAWTLEAFQRYSDVEEIILVTSKDDIAYVRNQVVEPYGIHKVKHIIEGGSERQSSVKKGLDLVEEGIVLVHDGVRPFIKEEIISSLIKTLSHYKACAVGVPVKDTIKVLNNEKVITGTPDRSTLWSVQTPQAFHVDVLKKAHDLAMQDGYLGTDDTVLVEKYIELPIKMIEGSYNNIKITTKEDITFGEFLLDSK